MTVQATQKYVRITPRKLREIADLVRGRDLMDINDMLTILNKRGARVMNETIRQAVANAVNNHNFSEEQLSLSAIIVNEGPIYKRFRAGARGRAKPYVKRTSHITVQLAVAGATPEPVKPVKAVKSTQKAAEKKSEVVETKEAPKAEKKVEKKSSSKKAAASTSKEAKK